MLSPEQIEKRKTGLGASEIAAVLGLSPYDAPIDILLAKHDKAEEFVETDRVKWGNLLEDPIRDDYAKRHGVVVDVPGTLIHPDETWALATPDGLILDAECVIADYTLAARSQWWERGLEIKTHTVYLSHMYGEPGSDDVPPHELVQCAWNMYVTDLSRWDLVAFLDGLPVEYHIARDRELEEMMVEAARAFWFDYVVGDMILEPDGSPSYSRELARRFPEHEIGYAKADGATTSAISGLCEQRRQIREFEREEERLVQIIKTAIGEHAGVESGAGKISWRRSRDSERVDWKAVAEELFAAAPAWQSDGFDLKKLWSDIVAKNTNIKPGSRRFVVPRSGKWSK